MHQTFTALTALAFATAFTGCTTPTTPETTTPAAMQSTRHFKKQIVRQAELDYLLYLPTGYQRSGPAWPLMLFLHGAGERGTNVDKVAVHGPPKLTKAGAKLPFIIASPQCPDNRIWRDDELLALLDDLVLKLNVDTNRIYLTGLSMGGYGTWSLGTKFPERFAAIAPICGGGEQLPILLASREKRPNTPLKTMGVWAFHGAKDPTVPLEESQRMTNALMRAGCKDVKLTVYPDAGHDSWTQAYEEPELWNWFLSHRRD
jgi:predicted peptidase